MVAKITINGVDLAESHEMTLRVALSGLRAQMAEPNALGTDAHGRAMAKGYIKRCDEILQMLASEDYANPDLR